MKTILLSGFFCTLTLLAVAQNSTVTQAEEALNKNNFTGAYDAANDALKVPKNLDKTFLSKAYYIRAKAGVKISNDAMLSDDNTMNEQYVKMPLQSYHDFKQAASAGDATMQDLVKMEYNKLGNALLVAGTEYDSKFKNAGEAGDSSLLDREIENFNASIEIFSLINKEKFKPYLFRGDAFFAKKQYSQASEDYHKAWTLFENTPHDYPDFNIGDLGYRLAYMEAAIFNKKDVAAGTIAKARKLLAAEMALADAKKEKFGERYAEYKSDYQYFLGELAELEKKVK